LIPDWPVVGYFVRILLHFRCVSYILSFASYVTPLTRHCQWHVLQPPTRHIIPHAISRSPYVQRRIKACAVPTVPYSRRIMNNVQLGSRIDSIRHTGYSTVKRTDLAWMPRDVDWRKTDKRFNRTYSDHRVRNARYVSLLRCLDSLIACESKQPNNVERRWCKNSAKCIHWQHHPPFGRWVRTELT